MVILIRIKLVVKELSSCFTPHWPSATIMVVFFIAMMMVICMVVICMIMIVFICMVMIVVVCMVSIILAMVVIAAIIYVIVRIAVAVLKFVDSDESVIVLVTIIEQSGLLLSTLVSEVIISIEFLLVHSVIVSKQELIEDFTCFVCTIVWFIRGMTIVCTACRS